MSHSIITCPFCGCLQRLDPLPPAHAATCPRCGSTVAKAKAGSLGRTAALSLAALLLYVPANIYPVLRMDYHGMFTENTIWDGVVQFFRDGDWFIGAVVFAASILIPLLKLLGLFFLVITARLQVRFGRLARMRLHKVIEAIGPWAMLDVFLLAILIALVKLRMLATVTPGPGMLPFAAVVVLTILASASFEPKLLWEDPKP